MGWLTDIFESKTDQARLIAIVISAVIAITIVLINQWFLSGHSGQNTVVSNISEICSLPPLVYNTRQEYLN